MSYDPTEDILRIAATPEDRAKMEDDQRLFGSMAFDSEGRHVDVSTLRIDGKPAVTEMQHTLHSLKAAIIGGDTLAFGELPHVLAQCHRAAIQDFAREIRPALATTKDEGLMTMVETIIADELKDPRHRQMREREQQLSYAMTERPSITSQLKEMYRKRAVQRGALPPEPNHTLATMPDNDPARCAALGLKPFDVDGSTVWAGSLKAAVKKAKKMKMQEGGA